MRAPHAIAVRSLVLAGVMMLALAVAAIARPAQFNTKSLSDHHVGKTKTELKAQMAFSGYVLQHFKDPAYRWRLLPRHATCWSNVPSRRLRHVCNHARITRSKHLKLYQLAESRYERLYAPRPAPVATGPGWLVQAFLCIHSHEGSWTDSGNPYWGGLQFGPSEWTRFGGQYAPTANLATPDQQIAAAIAYWHLSGFSPWPSTARMCGLL